MKQAVAIAVILASIFSASSSSKNSSTNWAVLVAGSNGYYNYRHQADVAHSYQILHKMGGYPKENIIVMMYNDVVNASDNPLPGQLFNEPGGVDVYADIEIAYSGEEVTAENFLNVIQGKKHREDHRVLESGPNDNVFIYYSDHGANGLVAMPVGDPLYAKDLIEALNFMHNNSMYSQLVFYLEACESGSMFAGILSNTTNVFATTAATPDEPSYAYYYNDTLSTYMADEYSIRWMQDSTNNWDAYESLIEQFQDVAAIVNESQPQKYGDLSFDAEPIEDFEAYQDRKSMFKYYAEWVPSKEAVSSRDVKLAILQHRYLAAQSLDDKMNAAALVEAEIAHRLDVDILFEQVIDFVVLSVANEYLDLDQMKFGHVRVRNWECLKFAYSEYESYCARFDDYSLKYVNVLVNLCETFGDEMIIADAFEEFC